MSSPSGRGQQQQQWLQWLCGPWGGRDRQDRVLGTWFFRLGRVFRRALLEVTVAKCWSCILQVGQFHAGTP